MAHLQTRSATENFTALCVKTHNFNSSKLTSGKSFILNQSKELRLPKMKCPPSKIFPCQLICLDKTKGNYLNFTISNFIRIFHLYDETFSWHLWKSRWCSERKCCDLLQTNFFLHFWQKILTKINTFLQKFLTSTKQYFLLQNLWAIFHNMLDKRALIYTYQYRSWQWSLE